MGFAKAVLNGLFAGLIAFGPGTAWAQDVAQRQQTVRPPTLNFNGVAGLVDMPSGESATDGSFSWNFSTFGGISRSALSFQLTPRLSGSFRYTEIKNWNFSGFATYYDRSFDLRFRLLDEGRYVPAVTIGLQDFIGTGLLSGEYIAATKNITPRLKVTAGLGWGRLGTYQPIGTLLGVRPRVRAGLGGNANFSTWFRGPAAPFGGVEWQATDRIGLKAEYSSDAYTVEAGSRRVFDRRSPWNFGVEYQATPSLRFSLNYLHGSEVGFNAQLVLDPKRRPRDTAIQGGAPAPVKGRPDRATNPDAYGTGWVDAGPVRQAVGTALAALLAADGMELEGLTLEGTRARVRIRNKQFDSEAQAIGRAARLLSQVLPASVEEFQIVPVANGMALSVVTIRRSDLEALELQPDGAAQLRERVTVQDAAGLPRGDLPEQADYPRFRWAFAPYTQLGFFDPSKPVRGDFGLRLRSSFEVAPGLIFAVTASKKLAGNLDARHKPNSSLPHVRTDGALYAAEQGVRLDQMTLAWYSRPATNIYGRVTAGYLERMFAGISGEVLWSPVNNRLAIGAEINLVQQRQPDEMFTLRDYRVATGHVSAYYRLDKGYRARLDAGRYLAGDVGATFTLEREFASGWRVGVFATKTNISAAQFGEGSFDKGISLTIPLNWVTGQPSRRNFSTTIRSLTRDGGARLSVDGRLFPLVRDYHGGAFDSQWARVLR